MAGQPGARVKSIIINCGWVIYFSANDISLCLSEANWAQERTGAREGDTREGRHVCLPRAPPSFFSPLFPSAC